MATRYAALGRRLRVFFITRWTLGEAKFCEALGVTKIQLEKYFNGTRNPADLFQRLAKLGADVHYLATGEHKEGLAQIMAMDKMRSEGIIDINGMCNALLKARGCQKCHANDNTYADRVEWVNSIYQRSLN